MPVLRVSSIVLVLGLCLAAAAGAEETIPLGGMTVTVWDPSASGLRPIVLFSHGFHGCSTQSRFLMEALASAGYIVFAPNHADATCEGGEGEWSDPPEVPFERPEDWNDATYRARADDIEALINAIAADPRWTDRVDWSRLALAGHSLGGYTMLGLGGAWETWRLSGVKALLALSPYADPYILFGTLPGLSAPVMYQGGTLDFGVTPSIAKPGGAYDQSPPSKYFVEFEGFGHFAWTDLSDPATRELIVDYSLAFLDHHVNGDPAAALLTSPAPGVASLRYELGRAVGVDRGPRQTRVVTRP